MCKPACGSAAGVLSWPAGDRKKVNPGWWSTQPGLPFPDKCSNRCSTPQLSLSSYRSSFTHYWREPYPLGHKPSENCRSSIAATTQIPPLRRWGENRSRPVPRCFSLVNSRQIPEDHTQDLVPFLRCPLHCVLLMSKYSIMNAILKTWESTCSNTWLVNSQLFIYDIVWSISGKTEHPHSTTSSIPFLQKLHKIITNFALPRWNR